MVDLFEYVQASDVPGADDGSDTGWDPFGAVASVAEDAWDETKKIAKKVAHVAEKPLKAAALGTYFAGPIGGQLAMLAPDKAIAASRKITSSPIWNIAQTGVAFIPGVGQAVSAGMAQAAALGRNESLTDVGLAAARSRLSPTQQAAFDVAVGAMRHQHLDAQTLRAVRSQLPGGDGAQGAFDAAIAVSTNMPQAYRDIMRARLSPEGKAAYDIAVSTRPAPIAPALPPRPPAFRAPPALHAVAKRLPQPGGRTRITTVPIPMRPPNIERVFPAAGADVNRIASALITQPAARDTTPAVLGRALNVDTRDVQDAIAMFLSRFAGTKELDWRDVGELEPMSRAAGRHGIVLPRDLSEWPGDVGAIESLKVPPVAVGRAQIQSLYRRGDSVARRAILAHELLAHTARNTGELTGTTWVIQGNGDWPYKVAQTVVGDGNRWKEILALNPFLKLQSNGNIPQWTKGTRIQLPPSWFPSAIPVPSAAAAAAAAPAPAAQPATGGSVQPVGSGPPFPAPSEYPLGFPSAVYVNRAGDTGEKIAARITGNKNRWRELLTVNPKLAGPHGIEIWEGKTIALPPSWVRPQASPATLLQPATPPPTMVTIQPVAKPPVSDGGIGGPPPQPPFSTGGGIPSVIGGIPDKPVVSVIPAPPPAIVIDGGIVAPPAPSAPVVTGSAEQIAILQLMLGAFFREHSDAGYGVTDAPYGARPEDYAGVWTERTTAALRAFQKWWNAHKPSSAPALATDGLPDGDTVSALIAQTQADGGDVDTRSPIQLTVGGQLQKAAGGPSKKKKSGGGDMVIPIGLLLAALGS